MERQLDLSGLPENPEKSLAENERKEALGLAEELVKPVLSANTRLRVVAQMREVMGGSETNFTPYRLGLPASDSAGFA